MCPAHLPLKISGYATAGQCHKMIQGGGREFAIVSNDIFFYLQALILYLELFSKIIRKLFLEKIKCHVSPRGRGGVQTMSQYDTLGRGPKIS